MERCFHQIQFASADTQFGYASVAMPVLFRSSRVLLSKGFNSVVITLRKIRILLGPQ